MIMYFKASDSISFTGIPPSPELMRTGRPHFSLRYPVAKATASQARVDKAPIDMSEKING